MIEGALGTDQYFPPSCTRPCTCIASRPLLHLWTAVQRWREVGGRGRPPHTVVSSSKTLRSVECSMTPSAKHNWTLPDRGPGLAPTDWGSLWGLMSQAITPRAATQLEHYCSERRTRPPLHTLRGLLSFMAQEPLSAGSQKRAGTTGRHSCGSPGSPPHTRQKADTGRHRTSVNLCPNVDAVSLRALHNGENGSVSVHFWLTIYTKEARGRLKCPPP